MFEYTRNTETMANLMNEKAWDKLTPVSMPTKPNCATTATF